MRDKINQILYNHYDDWSYLKARDFKHFHRYKCRHISLNELYLYSSKGLMEGIVNYKCTGTESESMRFLIYVNKYITGALYKGLTDLMPLSSVSKYNRKSTRYELKYTNPFLYKHLLQTKFLGNEHWRIDYAGDKFRSYREYENPVLVKKFDMENYMYYWDKINQLEPFAMRILHYKYSYYFDIIRSNKDVAELMCCSDETVRKSIHSSFHKIFENIL
jgi:hypothetical protein